MGREGEGSGYANEVPWWTNITRILSSNDCNVLKTHCVFVHTFWESLKSIVCKHSCLLFNCAGKVCLFQNCYSENCNGMSWEVKMLWYFFFLVFNPVSFNSFTHSDLFIVCSIQRGIASKYSLCYSKKIQMKFHLNLHCTYVWHNQKNNQMKIYIVNHVIVSNHMDRGSPYARIVVFFVSQ